MTGVRGGAPTLKHDPHEKASRDEAVRYQMNLHFLVAVRRFDELLTAHKQAALIWPAVGDIAPDDDVLQAFLDETEAGRGAQAVLAALRAAPCAADLQGRGVAVLLLRCFWWTLERRISGSESSRSPHFWVSR